MRERVSLGARIRDLRTAHSLTMQELSEQTGISQGHLSSIESGKAQNPGIETVKSIATCFGLTVSELLLENHAEVDDKLALLTRWYSEDLDTFGQEAVLVIANHHRHKRP